MMNKIKFLILIMLCAFSCSLLISNSTTKVEANTYIENESIVIDTFYWKSESTSNDKLINKNNISYLDNGNPTLELNTNGYLYYMPGSKEPDYFHSYIYERSSTYEHYYVFPYPTQKPSSTLVDDLYWDDKYNTTDHTTYGWIYCIHISTSKETKNIYINSNSSFTYEKGFEINLNLTTQDGAFYYNSSKINNIYVEVAYLQFEGIYADDMIMQTYSSATYYSSFYNDVSAPQIQNVTNNSLYNTNQEVVLYDSNSNLLSSSYLMNETTGEKKNFSYGTSSSVNTWSDGNYYVYAINRLNLVSELRFTIDTTSPSLTISTENLKAGETLTIISDEDITLSYASIVKNYSKVFNLSYDNYSDWGRTNAGEVNFTATDKAGNTTSFIIYIDMAPPTIENLSSKIYNPNTLPDDVTWTDNQSGIKEVTLNGQVITDWDKSLITNTNLTGTTYNLVVTDNANNSTTVTFYYDDLAPVISYSSSLNGHISLNTKPDITDYVNVSTDTSIYITFTEGTATLNGINYISGTEITIDDEYVFIITDSNNNSDTYYFTINNYEPTGTLTSSSSGTYDGYVVFNSSNITFSNWGDAQGDDEVTIKLNGIEINYGTATSLVLNQWWITYDSTNKYYAYTTYASAYSAAKAREELLVETGTYSSGTITSDKYGSITITDGTSYNKGDTYYIYKSPTSSSTYIAYFSKDNLDAAIKQYATESISVGNSDFNSIAVIDKHGRNTIYEFYINPTIPALSFDTVQENNDSTNQDVKINSNSLIYGCTPIEAMTYTLNGSNQGSFNINTVFSKEGTYVLTLKGTNGLTTTYNFTIDKTPVELITDDVLNGGSTNQDVTFTWNEDNCILYVNDSAITTNSNTHTIKSTSGDGTITLKLIDSVGNEFSFSYTLDTTAPTGTLTGVTNDGSTNQDVTYSFTEGAVTLNGSAYKSNNSIKSEGTYELLHYDDVGNVTKITFTIDKTAPEGVLTTTQEGGFREGNLTNGNVTFTWSESGCSATLNGSTYTKGTTIKAEGTHKIILNDAVGNILEIEFTIDKTAPTGTLVGVTNGGSTNQDVTLSWTDSTCSASLTHVLNESTITNSYSSGNKLTENGEYTINLVDLAGNSTTYTFTIDKIAVELIADVVSNGGSTNQNVTFTWKENGCTLYLNNSIVSTSKSYTMKKTSGDGIKNLVLIDNLGNEFSFSYTLDTTAPTGTLTGVTNGGSTNQNVSLSCIEQNVTATLNGEPYKLGTTITEEGLHTITLYDAVGNSTTYSFTIDKTPVELKADNVVNGGSTNQNVTFTWSESSCTLYVNNSVVTTNGNTYTIKNTFGDGVITLKLIDSIGNEFTFNYTLLTEEPKFTVYYNGTIIETKSSYNYKGISIDFTDATAKLNGDDYTSGTIIETESSYVFEITDKLGNKATFEFTLDYTPYTENYEYFLDNYCGKINHWWTTYDYVLQQQDSKNVYVKNTTYSFASYQSAEDYAIKREYSLVESGIYISGTKIWSNTYNCYVDIYSPDLTLAVDGATYYIYKSPSSATTYVAYFSEATSLQPTYTQYALDSIKELNNTTSTIGSAYTNENIYLSYNNMPYIFVKGDITFNYKPNTNKLYVNGNETSYLTTITEDGIYLIREEDEAGNIFEYYLCKDTEAGTFKVSDITNPGIWQTQLNTTSSIFVTEPIKIAANDSADPNAILKIVRQDGTIEYCYNGSFYQFNETGKYTISVIDTAKNTSSTKTVTLSFESPSVSFETKYDSNQKAVGFYVRFTAGNKLNELSSISIQIYDTENQIWETLDVDAEGTLITSANTEFYFTKSGQYLVHWMDNFGRSSKDGIPYVLERDKPEGFLTSNNQIIESGYVTYNTDGTINQIYPTLTNNSVYLTWNDETGSKYISNIIYMNGEYVTNTYYKNNFIKDAGTYIIRLTNDEGAYKDFVFTIDKTPCEGELFTEENEKITSQTTNKNFYLTWSEENVKCYYITKTSSNKLAYYKGTIITEENSYTFYLYDEAGNESIYTITKDITPPAVSIYSGNKLVANNSYVNKDVKFVFSEKNVTATVNGDEYVSGTVLKSNIQYTLVISDSVGNSAIYRTTKDNSPIVLTLYDSSNQSIELTVLLNKHFKFYVNKDDCEITLNGFTYEPGTLITKDSVYSISALDKYGNSFVYELELDTTAPEGVLTTTQEGGFREGNLTNGNVTFTWDGYSYTALLNEVSYTKNSTIKNSGNYILKLIDKAGNITEYTFTIDKNPVEFTLTGVEDAGYTNQNVKITWEEENCTAKLNNIIYNQEEINYESSFIFEISDLAGNISQVTFTIDKTAPEGVLITTQEGGFREGNLTNGNVTFTWSGDATATLNGESYYKGSQITKNNNYELVLTDKANNSSTYIFTIDKSIPTGTLVGVEENGITNSDVKFVWENENNYTATLNGTPYTNGNTISDENYYEVIIYSASGCSKTYNFTIDKTAPEGVLTTTQEGGFRKGNITNGSVVFTWSENASATLNGNTYYKGTQISKENSYEIILTDKANNSSKYYFTIDKTAPSINLTGVVAESITNKDVEIEIVDEFLSVTVLNITTNEEVTTEDRYIKLTQEGNYYVTIVDHVLNKQEIYFTIDKTAPEGVLTTTQEGGFCEGNITNGNVTFTWSESGCSATINDATYTKGTTIKKESTYVIVLTDKANNSSIYSFEIDKTPVETNLIGVKNGDSTNSSVSIEIIDEYLKTVVLNTTTNETYETKDKYIEIDEEGTYFITIYDPVLNPLQITFTIDKTAPEGVLTTTQEGGFREGNLTNGNVTFTWSESGCSATLNNQPYTKGTTIKAEGTHEIILTDHNSNSRKYCFTIDKTAPTFVINGNLNKNNVTKDNIHISWDELNCVATLNNNPYTLGELINTENTYYFALSDFVGNMSDVTFTIDKTAPTGTLTGVIDGGITAGNVTFTWSESGCSATLNNESYYKGTIIKSVGLYEIALYDAVGNCSVYSFEINKDNPLVTLIGVEPGDSTNQDVICVWNQSDNYTATLNGEVYTSGTSITEEGVYELIVTGVNQVSMLISFEIDKTAPTVTLQGVSNNGTTNGKVKLTWDEVLEVTINGEAIKKGTEITKEGSYTVMAKDQAGNSIFYVFSIDTTCVSIELQGVEDGGITNKDVIILWNESATAKLNDNYHESGTVISDEGTYKFWISDPYGNILEIEFTIDKTAPEGVLTTTQEGGFRENNITPGNIYLTWDEAYITVTVNGQSYSKGSVIKQPGKYTFSLIDKANNVRIYEATIDKTIPEIIFNDEDGNLISSNIEFETAKDVMLSTNTPNTKLFLNGVEYDNSLIVEDGKYNAKIVYLPTGVFVEYIFTIDKTAPTGTLTGVTNGGITATNVKFTWEGYNYNATLNGEPYSKDSSIKENGEYVLVLTNKLGVSTEYTFTINKTYPTISFTKENDDPIEIELNKHMNYNVKFTCDPLYEISIDGEVVTGEIILSDEKEYVIDIHNPKNQLKTTYVFVIDKTAPEFNIDGLELNSGLTNKAVKITWERSAATLYVNDELITSLGSHTISKNGTYKVKLVDLAGNIAEFEFERFKNEITSDMVLGETKTINSETGEEVITQSKIGTTYTQAVKFIIPENHKAQLKYKNAEGEEVIVDYTDAEIKENNSYYLIVSDKFGNQTQFKFRMNIDYSVEEPNYLGQNLALLAIILIPTFGILAVIIVKLVNKKKNPFGVKKIK